MKTEAGTMADKITLSELILYISLRSEGDARFGMTKLNTLVYFIDAASLREFGTSLTGQKYVKKDDGPVPVDSAEAVSGLLDRGKLAIRPEIVGYSTQRRPFACEPPDELFTCKELWLVNSILDQYKGFTAGQCSALSHESPGWRMAAMGESFPVSADLLSERELTPEEKAYAKELVEEPEVLQLSLVHDL